eukprot:TRINITY_DN4352_c0_g1_i1.p1 TRINITY_DN4352_c0_g1~~TRINITY_DN4352_c0_g1_i1.p1  ORF type:complete len:922 (+),score=120.84 TRINITY_DN4352_c0_g1_i1:139-2904(+)
MAGIAERLTILSELGEGLLIRFYNIKVKYDGVSRPAYMSDPALAKVIGALPKKFPDLPTDLEKVPGYDVFASKAPQLYAELESDYDAFLDAHEWVRLTEKALTDITQGLSGLQIGESPLVTQGYMELVVKFIQLNILITMINDRRVIVTAFARLSFIMRNKSEPNFERIAQFLTRYAFPFVKLPEILKPCSKRIGQALSSLMMPYMKTNDLQYLRKEGLLNITLNPDKIALPAQDPMQLNLLVRDKMLQWILWGFLFCADELEHNDALVLIRVCLTHCWRLTVFRDVTVSVHAFYDMAWKGYKSKTFKLAKERKIIVDAANSSALGDGAGLHHSYRIFLRQSLSSLLMLFKDFPGLLGPKITLLWSGLAQAKAEILWYYRHIGSEPPKTKDKFMRENFRDRNISELLYLVNQLIQLVRQHQRVIQSYYLEYLNGADCKDLQKHMSKASSSIGDAGPIIQDVLRELSNINPQALASADSTQTFDFTGLRLNWYRVEAKMSATAANLTVSQAKELVHRGRLIYLHSRNVDQLEEQIEEYASLKMLWYFRDLLVDSFEKAINDGPCNPLYTTGYLHLLAEFPENTTPFLPEEKEFIGPECVQMAQSFLDKITQRVAQIMMEIGTQYLTFNDQLKPENAAYPLLLRQKDYKFEKNFVHPATPGEETQHKARPDMEQLRLRERNVYQLCTSMQDFVDIAIYDHKFIPREYLRDKLASVLRSFIKQAVVPDTATGNIQRPSILETQFNMFFSTIKLVENYVDIDIGDLISEVCLKQIHNKAVSEVNKIDWTAEGEITWGNDVYLMKCVSKWYGEFVSKKLQIPGISYSANRRAFISRAAMPFKAEDYADLAELSALCRLVGPYGVKAIDREAMKFIVENIAGIKGVLKTNKQHLEFIAQNYHKDVASQIKNLKGDLFFFFFPHSCHK